MIDFRSLFIGLDVKIPLMDGSSRCYVNLDNAASTPPLKAVQQSVDIFLAITAAFIEGLASRVNFPPMPMNKHVRS